MRSYAQIRHSGSAPDLPKVIVLPCWMIMLGFAFPLHGVVINALLISLRRIIPRARLPTLRASRWRLRSGSRRADRPVLFGLRQG
jgi:hypothetical protein